VQIEASTAVFLQREFAKIDRGPKYQPIKTKIKLFGGEMKEIWTT
jgi:hypothetical protein